MKKNIPFKKACLAVATGMLSMSAMAESTWNLSGWLNESMLYYDDGNASEITQVSDNGTTLGTRMTFAGTTDLPAGLNAGFEIILEPQSVNTPLLFSNQTTISDTNGHAIGVLGNSVNIGGAWGKFTLGLQSMPTDNIAVLADPSLTLWQSIGVVFRGNGFAIRGLGAGATNTTWGSFLQCQTVGGAGIGLDCNGIYRNGLRYDLPTFVENINIAVGYANDDIFDVAGKWNGQLGRLKAILHLGYTQNNGVNGTSATTGYEETNLFQMQAGLMDPATGIFGTIAYQNEDADQRSATALTTASSDSDVYWLKVGIKKAFNSLGDTALAFQYGSYNDQYGATAGAGVTGSEVERYGFEISQYLGSRVIIYGVWENFGLDVDGTPAAQVIYGGAEDLDFFSLGVTYFF